MKWYTKPLLTAFVLGSLLYSCTEDYFEFDKITTEDWRPEVAIPLINSTLTLEDILTNKDTLGIVSSDPNSDILQIVYEGKVFSESGSGLVTIPNQSFNESAGFPIIIPPFGGPPITVNENREIGFTLGVEVDSTLLKQGSLILTLENEFQHNLTVTLSLPDFVDRDNNNQALNLTFTLPARTGSTPTVRSQIIDLNGYFVDMTNGAQNHSTINLDAQITLNPITGNTSTLSERLSINGEFRNIDFKELAGYLGPRALSLDLDTLKVDLFKNFTSGDIFLSNPTLEITIGNSFGIPMRMTFDTLRSRNSRNTPPEIDINLPTNPKDLNYPNGYGYDTTLIVIDRSTANSNLSQVISSKLKEIIYDARGDFNVNNPGTIRNYITDTSQVSLDVFLKIPFEGYAQDFQLVDTLDLVFDNVNELESGILRVAATNTFPVDAQMQVVFTDDNFVPIDSMFDGGPQAIVPAGTGINNAGATETTDFPISGERFEKIASSTKMLLRAVLNSRNSMGSPPDTIQFRNENRLKINLGLKGKILID